jgi:hypothetical protein
MAKIGRNQRRPCGSGLKYKKCHGSLGAPSAESAAGIQHALAQTQAKK